MAGPSRYQHVTSAELENVAAVAQPLKRQDLYAERLYLDWRHSKISTSPADPEVTTWPAQVNGILELPMAQFAKELLVDDDIDDDFIQEVAKLEAAAVSQSSITKAVKESDAWLTPDVLSEIDDMVATHTVTNTVNTDMSHMFQGATFTGNPVFNVTIQIPPK
eukprot:jgi/Mesvir1/29005/Mv17772-RA.1